MLTKDGSGKWMVGSGSSWNSVAISVFFGSNTIKSPWFKLKPALLTLDMCK